MHSVKDTGKSPQPAEHYRYARRGGAANSSVAA